MDWLRRNWPDLLIGLALVAVIAGIIATLISGGSFFPAGNRTAENPGQGTTPLTGPASAGAQSDQVNSDDDAAGAGLGAADLGAADTDAAAGDSVAADGGVDGSASTVTATPGAAGAAAAADAAGDASGDASGAAVGDSTPPADQSAAALPVAVLPPAGQSSDGPSAAAGASSAQEGATPSTSSSVSSTAAAAGDAGADSGANIPASASSEAPYRVSVGAYANRANAEGQAATFQAAGYPVFIGEQGNLNIVLVGPYDSESEARSVAAAISNADFGVADPTVYEFTGDEEDQAAAQATASSSASSVSSSAAGQSSSQPGSEAVVADDDTVITSSPAADGVRYLQAGAYGSRDSSLPQRDRLEGLGFVVTERVENDLVKLLIGPFDTANLENAESRLEAAGIASFPR